MNKLPKDVLLRIINYIINPKYKLLDWIEPYKHNDVDIYIIFF
jgi:hypothetical protein